jgi:membrane protease YdiL (CAAX protease family)
MNSQTTLSKILSFFLIKMIIGIAAVVGSVFLVEWLGRLLLDQTQLTDDFKNIIIAVADAMAALLTYVFVFRFYEHRKIKELSVASLGKNAIIGFATGLILQSIFILIILIFGKYSIIHKNPVSFFIPSFAAAFTAGFVAEILIVGIFFRLAEEKLGTLNTLLISFILFAVMHVSAKGATTLSVLSTAMQAGVLLPAVFIYSRNLWIPIFLHFAWDFAEPGIFGGINPGMSIGKSLFTSTISGTSFLTGGQTGPQNSIQSLVCCSAVALILLRMAKEKNRFIQPFWKK